MAQTQDVEIPQPLTSGTVDHPDAVQEGTPAGPWENYAPAKASAKAKGPWENYAPTPAAAAKPAAGVPPVTPPPAAGPKAPYEPIPGLVPRIVGEATEAYHHPWEAAKGLAKGMVDLAGNVIPSVQSQDIDTNAPEFKNNPYISSGVKQAITSEPKQTPRDLSGGVVSGMMQPQNTAQQGGYDAAQAYGAVRGALEVGHGIKGALTKNPAEAARVALTRPADTSLPKQETLAYHEAEVEKTTQALKEAEKTANHYATSPEGPPKKVNKALEKAQAASDEAKRHYENFKQGAAPDKPITLSSEQQAAQNARPQAAPAPLPTMAKLGAPKVAENVKTPGQVRPETFPQTPTEKPVVEPGQRTLANDQGTVGMRKMLTEGTPQAAPAEAPKAEAPTAPATMAKLGKPERGNLKQLKVDETGKVVDTKPEDRLDTLLQQALKPAEEVKPAAEIKAPATEAPKVRGQERRQETTPVAEERRTGERRNAAGIRVDEEGNPVMSPDVQGHWQSAAFGEKPAEDIGAKAREANPEPTRAETKGEAAKPTLEKPVPATEPGLMKAGEEGKEQPKSAAEYHPAVREQVTALPDEKLKQLAKAHGLNPDEYNFKTRDEGRHRTERDQLAEEVTKQMGDDEKINIGRNAEQLEHKAEMANKTKAERAASLFPRLRGPVDEFGNPSVAGGTSDFVPVEHTEYAKAVKENPQASTLTDPEETKNNKMFSNGKGVYYSISPEGDLQGVVNNSGEKGALKSVMPHAIENGAKTLDAWDLYLPKQYEKYGFERTKSVPYDTKEYGEPSEALKAGWKQQGWKDGDPYPAVQHMKLKEGATGRQNAAGSPLDEYGNPTVSGGSQAAKAKAKELPTGDQLIKKYGESSGDPADTTFILADGRGVKNTGSDHDTMLGGKATDKNPPREQFIADGNIRVRPRMGIGNREVSMSIPESGINTKQLAYIEKMAPQLRSGAVLIEVGKAGGDYRILSHGDATTENLGKALRELGPIKNEKGAPIDEFGNPTVSGGSQGAGTAAAKEAALPALAEEHLTPEEKSGILKSPRKTEKFVENMMSMPKVQEFVDAAVGGQGARKWYQRSQTAVESITKEAPEYFKEPGDHEKFTGLLAASSPRQSVAMNIREALGTWKEYVDAGRPEGQALKKLLYDNFTNKGGKTPNAMKALAGEPMWPDLTKNRAFKVPSFRDNLMGVANRVTNDGWMGLFSGIDADKLSDPENYHPISVLTREAAKQLNWEPKEAQAAIWSFIKTFHEKGGEVSPENIRHLSEDMADIVRFDPDTRSILKQLKVNLDQLDKRIADNTGEKPEITIRPSFSSTNSARQLSARIKAARGEAPIPKDIGLFDIKPESEDESTEFNPEQFKTQTNEPLEKLGKKKSPLKKML